MNVSETLVAAYKVEDAAGVAAYLMVVHGATSGSCKKPAAANAAKFVGFTKEAQPTQYGGAAVVKSGIARATAGATIGRGDRLVANGTDGKLKSVEALITAAPGTAAVFNVVATAEDDAVAGDVFPVMIAPCLVSVAAS